MVFISSMWLYSKQNWVTCLFLIVFVLLNHSKVMINLISQPNTDKWYINSHTTFTLDHGFYRHWMTRRRNFQKQHDLRARNGVKFTMLHFHHFNQYNWSLPCDRSITRTHTIDLMFFNFVWPLQKVPVDLKLMEGKSQRKILHSHAVAYLAPNG